MKDGTNNTNIIQSREKNNDFITNDSTEFNCGTKMSTLY